MKHNMGKCLMNILNEQNFAYLALKFFSSTIVATMGSEMKKPPPLLQDRCNISIPFQISTNLWNNYEVFKFTVPMLNWNPKIKLVLEIIKKFGKNYSYHFGLIRNRRSRAITPLVLSNTKTWSWSSSCIISIHGS